MQLIPYKSFTIKSQDSLDIVRRRLASQIEAPKSRWSLSKNHAPYAGHIADESFKITRIIHYRNSFLPIIRGKMESVENGTQVQIKMHLHPAVLCFLGLWCSIWFSVTTAVFMGGGLSIDAAFSFIGLPLFVFTAFWFAFWFEVNKSTRDLTTLLQGYPSRKDSFQAQDFFEKYQTILIAVIAVIFAIAIGLFTDIISVPFISTEPVIKEQVSCTINPKVSSLCNFKLAQKISGHPQASIIALSSEHQILVSGGTDKALKVWDLNTGQLKQTFQSDSGEIVAIAISPDGRFIVSGSRDRMVRVWDRDTGKRQAILKGHQEDVILVSIDSQGEHIISASLDGVFKSWDLPLHNLKKNLSTGSEQETDTGLVNATDIAKVFIPQSLSLDGKIALAYDSWLNVVAWDLEEGKKIQTLKNGFSSRTLSAHTSPDGQFALVEYGNNFKKYQTFFKIWDLKTGKVLAKNITGFSNRIFGKMPITVNKDYIIGFINGNMKIWSLKTGNQEASINAEFMRSPVIDSGSNTIAGFTGDPYFSNSEITIWQRS